MDATKPNPSAELLRALGVLAEAPEPRHRALAQALGLSAPATEEQWKAQFTEALVLRARPYASIYLGAEGRLGGEARGRVAGFWQAIGAAPAPEPDHLPVLLAGHARLIEASGDGARWMHARRAFLHEHLMPWLPAWLDRVHDWGPRLYAEWADLLFQALQAEAHALGQPPQRLALHLRHAPSLRNPQDEGLDALVESLLTPAISGLILFQDDLRQAAAELGQGCPGGNRHRMLHGLIEQDAAAACDWLADFASASARRHRKWATLSATASRHWSERAAASARLLARLSSEAREAAPADNAG